MTSPEIEKLMRSWTNERHDCTSEIKRLRADRERNAFAIAKLEARASILDQCIAGLEFIRDVREIA